MPTEKKMTGYPSIDKPWLKFYDTQFDEKKLPKKTMYELAFEQNKSNMSNVAIDIRMSANNFDKGITITYKEFFNRIQKCAKAAKKIGFMENDIIPIITPNVPEARILIYPRFELLEIFEQLTLFLVLRT